MKFLVLSAFALLLASGCNSEPISEIYVSEVEKFRYVVTESEYSWQRQLDEKKDGDILRQEFLIETVDGPRSYFLEVVNGTPNHRLNKYPGSDWDNLPPECIVSSDAEWITVNLSKAPKFVVNKPGEWVEVLAGNVLEMNGLTMFVFEESGRVDSHDFKKSPDGKVLTGGYRTECGFVIDRHYLVE